MHNKKLWFKRKRYGWGWFPVSVEGWLVIVIYVASMFYLAKSINATQDSDSDFLINFAVPFTVLSSILIAICYWKGETPKWSWGKDEHTI